MSEFTIEWREAEDDELSRETARCLKRLPDGWLQTMLELYGQGCSDAEIMRTLSIKPADFEQLMLDRQSTNFGEVVDIGRMLSRAWWEKLGRVKVESKNINVALYNLHMQNRFGWANKSEESRTNVESKYKDVDQLDEKLSRMLQKLGKA